MMGQRARSRTTVHSLVPAAVAPLAFTLTTAALAMALSACGGSVDIPAVTPSEPSSEITSATPAVSVSPVASSSSGVSATVVTPNGAPSATGSGEDFVAVVRSRVPEVAAGRTDDEIAGVGVTACEGLRTGTDAETIVETARSLNTLDAAATDHATARELVKLAIDTMCLDQAARVDEF